MGNQESSLIARNLRDRTVDQLLADDEFVKILEASTPSLSPKSRRNLRSLATVQRKQQIHSNGHLQSGKLKPLLTVKASDITLSPPISLHFSEWQLDWSRIFGQNTPFVVADSNSISKIYNQIVCLEKRRILDRIRWRFYTMCLYDLHNLINERTNLTSQGIQAIVQAIDTSGVYLDEVGANVRSWITRGHRYRSLSNSLGGSGCLFLLPEAISDYLWEESLPLKGQVRHEAIDLLKRLGIVEKGTELGAYVLGNRIEEGLLRSFTGATGQFVLNEAWPSPTLTRYVPRDGDENRNVRRIESLSTSSQYGEPSTFHRGESSFVSSGPPSEGLISPAVGENSRLNTTNQPPQQLQISVDEYIERIEEMQQHDQPYTPDSFSMSM